MRSTDSHRHRRTAVRTAVAPDANALTDSAVRLRAARKFVEAGEMFAEIATLVPYEYIAQYNSGAAWLEADRSTDAARAFERAIALKPSANVYTVYAHALALCGNIGAARRAYERALTFAPHDFDANWGLFEVNQLLDDQVAALNHQRIALQQRSLLSFEARVVPARFTILELCIAGSFQANIPLDFILNRDSITVHKLYLGHDALPALPPYDIVFNTIADAPNAGRALAAAELFIAGQDRPSLNAPSLVPATARDCIAERFAHSASVAVARTVPVTRSAVPSISFATPFLIRPLDSHAGRDLAKIDTNFELQQYLAQTPDVHEFFVSQFIDYRDADGFYRKYRIVFVDGVAYPVHMAVSPRWMIHYYNAPMAENAWMRAEECAFMTDINTRFTGVLAEALQEIAAAIRLDYFGIDCAIAPDGRLLLFEASTANIVHLRDPVDVYPYKAQFVPRIVAALERMIETRVRRGLAR